MVRNRTNQRRHQENYYGSDSYLRSRFERLIGRTPSHKNILSTILGTASIVMLCASLVEPKWFKLQGGKCCLEYIGPSMFITCVNKNCWTLKNALWNNEECIDKGFIDPSLNDCISQRTMVLIQVLIIFCFLGILFSLLSFVLDIAAPLKRALWKALKRYAIGYIFTVMFCATIVGFAYWVSEEIHIIQQKNIKNPGSKVEVSFDLGVYLVTAAGGLAILATASNLMRVYPSEEEEQADQLLEEMEDLDEEDQGGLLGGFNTNPPPPYNQSL